MSLTCFLWAFPSHEDQFVYCIAAALGDCDFQAHEAMRHNHLHNVLGLQRLANASILEAHETSQGHSVPGQGCCT
jgi:hypothetical protein